MLRRILPECSSAGNFLVFSGSIPQISHTDFLWLTLWNPSFNPRRIPWLPGNSARQNGRQSLFYWGSPWYKPLRIANMDLAS